MIKSNCKARIAAGLSVPVGGARKSPTKEEYETIKYEILTKERIETPGEGHRHAASVALCGGVPVAAWFAGTREKNPDVRIWFSRRDGSWSEPAPATPDDGLADWNPTLFCENGALTLIYKEGVDEIHWRSMKSVSLDAGEHWSAPKELVPGDASGGRGPVKNQMIRLSNGALLAPGSTEDSLGRYHSWTDYSDDDGVSWKTSAPVPFQLPSGRVCASKDDLEKDGEGLIQPALWEDSRRPGRVYMLARSSYGSIYASSSDDFGATWSVARPTATPNNNSGIGAAATKSGILGLACNPVSENWGPRTPLSLFLSTDNGAEFPVRVDLETEKDVEFSYPSIIAEGDILHIVYSWRREAIGYVAVGVSV